MSLGRTAYVAVLGSIALLLPSLSAFVGPSLRPIVQLGARELVGVASPAEPPDFAIERVVDGSFQRAFEEWFDARFGSRNLLVRLNNQLLHRVFARSYMNENRIVVGKDGSLFHKHSLVTLTRPPEPRLTPEYDRVAAKLATVQESSREKGIPIVFVISPDKAMLHPELVPAQARPSHRTPFRRRLLTDSLRAHGVRFVDGHEITAEHETSNGLPAFNPGGFHWNETSAVHTLNAAIRVLNRESGRSWSEVGVSRISSGAPRHPEVDAFELMNLLESSEAFRVPHATFRPRQPDRRRRGVLLILGRSFSQQLAEVAEAAELFGGIRRFLYEREVHHYPDRRSRPVTDFEAELWENGQPPAAILIERNEMHGLVDMDGMVDALLRRIREVPEKRCP